jgi:DNA transformation protein and related proteins
MPKPTPEFVSYCAELLAALGKVRIKPMFGGHGLYVDELFIAIVSDETLYLKADATSLPRFEQAGCAPFTYHASGEEHRLNYRTVPSEAMESPALMQPWARLAIEAALRARSAKLKPRASSARKTSG